MTFERIVVLQLACILVVAVVAAWASGATWRDITGIGDDPVSDPDATDLVIADLEKRIEEATR